MLTDKQKQAYLDAGGVKCPACNSEDLTGGSVDVDAGVAWQNIICGRCGLEWTDGYKLVEISKVFNPHTVHN